MAQHFWDNPEMLKVMIYLISTANFTADLAHNGTLHTSLRKLSSSLGISMRKTRTILNTLTMMNDIELEPSHRETLIRITDFSTRFQSMKYGNVVPFNRQHLQMMTQLSPAALKIGIHLILKSDYNTGTLTTSYRRLAEATKTTVWKVRTAFDELEKTDIIKATHQTTHSETRITIRKYDVLYRHRRTETRTLTAHIHYNMKKDNINNRECVDMTTHPPAFLFQKSDDLDIRRKKLIEYLDTYQAYEKYATGLLNVNLGHYHKAIDNIIPALVKKGNGNLKFIDTYVRGTLRRYSNNIYEYNQRKKQMI